jgi:hypothetical protein
MKKTNFRAISVRSLFGMFLAFGIAGCHEQRIEFSISPWDVDIGVRTYYCKKYPVFAEIVALHNETLTWESMRRGDELRKKCPVTEGMNSSPDAPLRTFEERTEKSKTEVWVTSVNLYHEGAERCRVVIYVGSEDKREGNAYSTLKPITAQEIRKLAEAVSKVPQDVREWQKKCKGIQLPTVPRQRSR